MPSKIDISIESEILKDYHNGLSKFELTQKYRLSPPTIRRVIKGNMNDIFPRISQSTILKIIEQSKIANNTQTKIAKKLEIDRSTVKRIFDHHQLTIEKTIKQHTKESALQLKYKKVKTSLSVDYLKELLSISINHAVIQTGISRSLILRYANEYNIPVKKKFKHTRDICDETVECVKLDLFASQLTRRQICQKHAIGGRHLKNILEDCDIASTIQIDETKVEEFKKYTKLVRRLTTVVKHHYGLYKKGYHVDHKISVFDGFDQNIPASLLASYENIELVPYLINLKKGTRSSITYDELLIAMNIKHNANS